MPPYVGKANGWAACPFMLLPGTVLLLSGGHLALDHATEVALSQRVAQVKELAVPTWQGSPSTPPYRGRTRCFLPWCLP